MVCSSNSAIGSKEVYRQKFEPVFKIKAKEAIKLVEEPLWSKLYSLTREIKDPNELKKRIDPVVQIDVGKVRENIWKLLIFMVNDNYSEKSFRENFEPLFRINSKRAVKLVENRIWKILYSLTNKTKDPEELKTKIERIVQVDVKRAAEAIKEVDPEKYEFLQLYK